MSSAAFKKLERFLDNFKFNNREVLFNNKTETTNGSIRFSSTIKGVPNFILTQRSSILYINCEIPLQFQVIFLDSCIYVVYKKLGKSITNEYKFKDFKNSEGFIDNEILEQITKDLKDFITDYLWIRRNVK